MRILKPTNIAIFTLLFAKIALASGGHEAQAGGHQEGLTDEVVKTVVYQAINVSIIFGVAIYFLRNKVSTFFNAKRLAYIEAAEKTKVARMAAEEEHLQMKVQLNKLESTAEESLSRAKAEAAEMRTQMLAEAAEISKRIKDEAALAAKLEVEKAKHHLREELLKESFVLAEGQLKSKVSVDDHARLQGEFITNIQAAQR